MVGSGYLDIGRSGMRMIAIALALIAATILGGIAVIFLLPMLGITVPKREGFNVAFHVAPDGRHVVFSAMDGQLYLLALETKRVRLVGHMELPATDPSFSPDGKQIVYASKVNEDLEWRICFLRLEGEMSQHLTDQEATSDRHPSYSPDGRKIAFARSYRRRPYSTGGWIWDQWDICVMHADGTQLRRLTNQGYYTLEGLGFSPDGKTIVFAASPTDVRDHNRRIFEVDLQGASPPHCLPRSASSDFGPRVSPNGMQMVFSSDRSQPYHYDLWLQNRDGTSGRGLGVASVSRYNCGAAFMPDGASILFLAETSERNSTRQLYSLWRVGLDGKNLHRIADSELFTHPLEWSDKP
jgi:TolB protein